MNRPSPHRWRLILIPFSWLFGLAVRIRNTLYEIGLLKATGFSIPIISVGNITVGGTGKTPHVEYLAGLLKGEFRVATLSRGYRRKSRDFRLVTPGSTVREVGDEPKQIKQRFPDVTVAVDRKRVNGVRELMQLEPPPEVILLDDAYQHRSIRAGLSILLIDYCRPVDRDHMLPAGMLREPATGRKRASIILVTRSPDDLTPVEMREYVKRLGIETGQHLYFTSIRYGDLVPVFGDARARDIRWYTASAGGVFVLSGIATPGPLLEFARTIHQRTGELTFSDHHRYCAKDLRRIERKYLELKKSWGEVLVLTTEKDAVKLRELAPGKEIRNAMHAVRIRVHFLNHGKEHFDNQINSYVTSNQRSRILHQATD
jgi:tetraacyldisaccharide 4'-kinase